MYVEVYVKPLEDSDGNTSKQNGSLIMMLSMILRNLVMSTARIDRAPTDSQSVMIPFHQVDFSTPNLVICLIVINSDPLIFFIKESQSIENSLKP